MNQIHILLITYSSVVAVFGNDVSTNFDARETCHEYWKKNQEIWGELKDIQARRLNITSTVEEMKFGFLEKRVFPRFKDVLRSLRSDPSKNVSHCGYQARTGIANLTEWFEREYEECVGHFQRGIDDLRLWTEELIKICENTDEDIKQLDCECSLGESLEGCTEERINRIWRILQTSIGSYVTLNRKSSFITNVTLSSTKDCVENRYPEINWRLSVLGSETKKCVENSPRMDHGSRSKDSIQMMTDPREARNDPTTSHREPNLINRAFNYLRDKWQVLSLGIMKLFTPKS